MSELRYYYAVPKAIVDQRGIRVFADMLRFEGARVEGQPGNVYVLSSILQPTVDRWRSFGIPVVAIETTYFNAVRAADASPVMEALRARVKMEVDHGGA